MGILMSKTDAGKLGACLRKLDQPGEAMIRIAIEPQVGLIVDVITPPFGNETKDRYRRVLEVRPPAPGVGAATEEQLTLRG